MRGVDAGGRGCLLEGSKEGFALTMLLTAFFLVSFFRHAPSPSDPICLCSLLSAMIPFTPTHSFCSCLASQRATRASVADTSQADSASLMAGTVATCAGASPYA